MADRKRGLREEGIENEMEGMGKDLKGRVKDAVGGLTGDEKLQGEGKLDRLKGGIQRKVGEIQRELGEDEIDRS